MGSQPRWLAPNFMMDTWSAPGRQWLRYDQPGSPAYFAFVEDIANPTNADALDGPDGTRLTPLSAGIRENPVRFRLAGIRAHEFLALMGRIDELDPATVNGDQRAVRRRQLGETVRDAHIPIIDIYTAAGGEDSQWLRDILRPGSWHVLLLNEGNEPSTGLEVFVGAPELGIDASFTATLDGLGRVPETYLRRLKDIFSLIHIDDADFGTEEEGGAEPTPPRPMIGPDGSDGAAVEIAWLDEASEWESGENAAEAEAERRISSRSMIRRAEEPPQIYNSQEN